MKAQAPNPRCARRRSRTKGGESAMAAVRIARIRRGGTPAVNGADQAASARAPSQSSRKRTHTRTLADDASRAG